MRVILNSRLCLANYTVALRRVGVQLLMVLLAVLPSICLAQIAGDVAGSADHRAIDRFPESRIILYESTQENNHQLLLGSMRRVGGVVVPERAEHLQGRVTRITYEVPQSFTGQDVFDFFVDQFEPRDYKELFSCKGRDCGNSSYWANNAFNNTLLNGPERNQFFVVLETPVIDGVKSYLSVYIITRANRRLYAYVEILDARSSMAGKVSTSLLTQLEQTGSAVVHGLQFDEQDKLVNDSGLADVLELLRANVSLRLYIVGHMRSEGDLENLVQRSLRRAEQVYESLVNGGVNPSRISPQGVGPLAPACQEMGCGQRVELVLQ